MPKEIQSNLDIGFNRGPFVIDFKTGTPTTRSTHAYGSVTNIKTEPIKNHRITSLTVESKPMTGRNQSALIILPTADHILGTALTICNPH